MVVQGLLFAENNSRKRKTLEKRIIFKLGTLIPQGLNKRFSFISSAVRFSFSNLTLHLLRSILASHSLIHSINTLVHRSFFLCFFSLIVLFLVTTDEGSSPKRIVIQALGYVLYLTKFMSNLSRSLIDELNFQFLNIYHILFIPQPAKRVKCF